MRITENFVDPIDDRPDSPLQVSVRLTKRGDGVQYVQFDFSKLTPRFCVKDLGALIHMLEALERRAEATS